MGQTEKIQKLLDIARAEIGYHEKETNSQLDSDHANSGDNNYTKYARDLAKANYYQASKQGYDWCDMFVDWCFLQLCGGKSLAEKVQCQTGPYGAGCYYSAQYYDNQGRLFTSNPQAGDQIFFNDYAHTGLVEFVKDGVIHTIEGNSDNQVIRRTYHLYSSVVTSFGRPKWEYVPEGKGFVDVPANAWFKEAVDWAVEKGITNGISNSRFAPNQTCTRAEAITMLWKEMGSPKPKRNSESFVDVNPNDFFYKAVLWAVENGITSGVDASHFGSNKPCTRAQAVTFLWSANKSPKASGDSMNDVLRSDWFYEPVYWAIDNKIAAGTRPGHFEPDDECSRAMFVQMLYKMDKML